MNRELVSVVILTYNSSKFIIETLESVRLQTHQNIELIISDDASKDNTLELCEAWLAENANRFARTLILRVPSNTGTSANYNRGLKEIKGEWVKYCAGDDALLPNCLMDNLNFVAINPDAKVLFSYCRMYKNDFTEDCYARLNPASSPKGIISDAITAADQYKLLLVCNRIPFTPSAFIHYETHIKYGIIDEKLHFSEDYQLWLSFTKNGCKLYFMEKETMKYRMHEDSASKQGREYIVNPIYYKTEPSIKALSYPFLPWDLRGSKLHIWYVSKLFRNDFFNRKTKINSLLHYAFTRILNPFNYIIYIKSHYLKKYKNDLFYKN
ncbi:MAG: glycosyltransferase [Flavobacterium sp.]